MITEQVVRIDVHKDRLIVRFKSASTEEGSHPTDGHLLSKLAVQQTIPARRLVSSVPKFSHQERNFWMQRPEAQ
jgi:hypothetical protein